MAIALSDILSKNLIDGLTPRAGQKSLTNTFNWVNIMEILDTPDNVQPDELLITTGYELNNHEKYKNLIPRLKSRGVAGLIIQTGYYIDSIPQYILEYGNNYSFPVLELPARYTFSEILHLLIDELNKNQNQLSKSYLDLDYFYSIIQNRLYNDVSLFQSVQTDCFIFAFSPANPITDKIKLYKNYTEHLISFLVSVSDDYVYEKKDNGQAVIYLTLKQDKIISAVSYDLQVQLTFISEQYGVDIFVGISEIATPDDLRMTLKNTIQCIALLDSIGAKRGICPYDNLTFIKMFGYLYRDNQAFVLENQALQTLLLKDRNNQLNYVQTLRVYLSENCNTTRTAERLFIHRHTLINRIKMIQDITGIDLDNYFTRIYLSMALLIHDFYAV
jgi:hypothetical protein